MPKSNPILEIKALVDTQPAPKRIALYRWLASVSDTNVMSHGFLFLADELERAEKLCLEFDFKFPAQQQDGHHNDGDGDGHHKKGDGK